MIDELDPPRSSDFLPECDWIFYEDFSEVEALSSTNNEDKVFNPDFNPPLFELPFHKEVPGLGALLSFSSENEEKVYNPWILTSKRVHTSLLLELSHQGTKAFKVTKILEIPMEIFIALPYQEGNPESWMVPCLHFLFPDQTQVWGIRMSQIFEASRASGFCPTITRASHPQLHFGNPISKSYPLTFIFKHT
ncbi:hypothetical protein Tco_1499318 [Tanacetum coccineum]